MPVDDEPVVQKAVTLAQPVQMKLAGPPEQFAVNRMLVLVGGVRLLAVRVHTGGETLGTTGAHIATGRPDVP